MRYQSKQGMALKDAISLKYALLFLIKSILNKIKKYNFKYYLRLLSKIKYLKLINKTNTTKKLFIYPKLPEKIPLKSIKIR